MQNGPANDDNDDDNNNNGLCHAPLQYSPQTDKLPARQP